ncbi:MAG: phosphoglycerate dehydrogenase [Pseudomonadota bacterium]
MSSLSLDKDRIRFLLLEGIHQSAVDSLADAGYTNVEYHKKALPADQLAQSLSEAHFVGIRSRTQLTEAVLRDARRLIAVGCFCIGTNQVDLEAAERFGVPVFNAPFSNTRSVAELVLAEIIMLMRGIPAKNAAAHRGDWRKTAEQSFEVRGKQLGIVGYGHIGTQLSVLAEALGMQVTFYDIEHKLPLGNAAVADDLSGLLGQSDAVSLHVPSTPLTQNMIDAEAISAMKPGAILVNASRGDVVDIDALDTALERGHIGGAAIDVFPTEPKANDEQFSSPLQRHDNVILTPHIGGSTQEAQQNIAVEVASKMIRYSDNGTTASAVNFPQASLPDNHAHTRILHIHRNEPGLLQRINRVFSERSINIAAQYLQTTATIGYVVMDVDVTDPAELIAELKALDGTVRARLLHRSGQ